MTDIAEAEARLEELLEAASPGPWQYKGGRIYDANGFKVGAFHRHSGEIDVARRMANVTLATNSESLVSVALSLARALRWTETALAELMVEEPCDEFCDIENCVHEATRAALADWARLVGGIASGRNE